MPQIGTIDVRVIEEAQSRMLSFKKNELDLVEIDGDLVVQALDGDKLKPELVKQGIKLSRMLEPSINYHYWNMQDPVVGGFTPEKLPYVVRWQWLFC